MRDAIPPPPWGKIHPVIVEQERERLAPRSPAGHFETMHFVRSTMGWSRDRWGGWIARSVGFHDGFQRTAVHRKATRRLGYTIFKDTLCALERACGVATITFHIHGERTPTSVLDIPNMNNIARNVTVHTSDNLRLDPTLQQPLANLRNLFYETVAIPFVTDWEDRAVESGHLSARGVFNEAAASTTPTTPITPARPSQPATQNIPQTPTRLFQPVAQDTPHTPSYPAQQDRHDQLFDNPSSPRTPGHAITSSTLQTLRWSQSVSDAAGSSTATPSSVSSTSVSSTSTIGNPGIFIPCSALDYLRRHNFGSSDDLERLRAIMTGYPQSHWARYIEASLGFDESTAKKIVKRLIRPA
ncbi:hypothetical protein BD410DRAFT_846178 [Rickenella mellea]|uniref:Uncharacterized protein n=1 Tax=Rickenella mellea TaxID=50990 RepID=A0A4Y7PFW3_9AGAM|nr:hypothetical protein BD410DRAFT_846178 [Rickenella mellea]